jgi:hypothetical protein
VPSAPTLSRVALPTRSQLEAWDTDCLGAAASAWSQRAAAIKGAFAKAQSGVDGVDWSGTSADQARSRLSADVAKVHTALEQLEHAEQTATRGAQSIANAKHAAVAAIRDAEEQIFSVSEDLQVTDPVPPLIAAPQRLARDMAMQTMQARIRACALVLASTDERVAAELKRTAADLEGFKLGGGPGVGPGAGDPPSGPRITGPAGPLKYDQGDYDLQDGYPDGQGPTFGGDPRRANDDGTPRDGIPRSPASQQAQDPNQPTTRSIPTGTALGPDGRRYAFFSYPDIDHIPKGNNPFATAGKAWDFTDPNHPVMLGPLKDTGGNTIYQASGAYDSKTGKMVIVGNTGPKLTDTQRVLWESDPVQPGDPPGKWLQSLHQVGTVQGLPGARENQLVALQGGGFALVGSDDFDPNHPAGRPAVSAVTAASPEGLTTAVPTTLIQPQNFPGAAPYGPTVVGTHFDPATGKETLDLRVSTWPGAAKVGQPYNPNTYTTTFTVQH